MRKFLILIAVLLFPLLVLAQDASDDPNAVEDDKGFLTRLLEKNLSGEGRTVTIDGFEGALSSRATFRQIVIADADGPWLTLKDGAIQWNRSALLRKRVDISELSAAEILVPRLPDSGEEKPKAEATPFALPELPVSLEIEKISAGRVELGEPVIGVEAAISVDGSMSLIDGEGLAKLTVNRLDGPRGEFVLDAGYSNDTKALNVNLALDEDENGLLVNLVNLYDKPAVTAQISGEGPLDGFGADLKLATNNQPRVTGKVSMQAGTNDAGAEGRNFRVQLGGDIASLLPPEERTFFGPKTELLAEGWLGDTGALQIPVLMLDTDALNLSGSVALSDKKAPESAVLLITLGSDAGASEVPVSLPMAGENATVESGRLELQYDSTEGQGWTLRGRVGQLDQGGTKIGALTLDGAGDVVLNDGALGDLSGKIDFGAEGLSFSDPGLAAAVGDAITGAAEFELAQGGALEIKDLAITGADYGLDGYALLSGLSGGIIASLDMEARYQDLSRLSTLAGRDLSGRADASVTGYYTVLSKSFDIDTAIRGTDISIDQPQADRLLAGESRINLSARRDETGIELEKLTVNAQRLTAEAQGYLNSNSSDLTAKISMPSLADADPNYDGSLEAEAKLNGPSGARRLSVSGEANDLKIGIEAVDGALQGRTTLAVIAGEADGGFQVETFRLSNPQLSAEGQGVFTSQQLDGVAQIEIPDLAAFRPDLSGSFSADAKLSQQDGARILDLTGVGQDLRIGQQKVDGALTGRTDLKVLAEEKEGVFTLRDVRVNNDQLTVEANGTYGEGVTDLTANADIRSLAPFGEGWGGSLTATGSLQQDADGTRHLDVSATGLDLAIAQPQVDGALAGQTDLKVLADEKNGVFTLRDVRVKNDQLSAEAEGVYGEGVTDISGNVAVPTLAPFGPGWRGSLNAEGSFREIGEGTRRLEVTGTGQDLSLGQAQVDGALAGETRLAVVATEKEGLFTIEQAQLENPRLAAQANGTVGAGRTDLTANLNASDLRFLGNGISGALNAEARVVEQGGAMRISANGSANGLSVGQPKVDPLLGGQTSFSVAATRSEAGISLQETNVSNPQMSLQVSGDPATSLTVDGRLNDLALILPEFPGPVEVDGTIRESGPNFVVDLTTSAPGPTRLRVNGSAARNFSTADLQINGTTDAAIANGMIRTRSIEGPISIDLRLNGRPSLEALSGQVRLTDGVLAEPKLGIRLENLDVAAGLQGGQIQLSGAGNVGAGGRITLNGPINPTTGTLDIDVVLDNVVASDPNLYKTLLNGEIRMSGRQSEGPLISGRINVGETEIRIPSTGLGGAKSIPDIHHVGDTRPMRSTRAKAGLEAYPSAASREAGLAGPPATPPANPPRLDLLIDAPRQIFIRGRGVDAEMGGSLRITGTTRNVIPIGNLQLIRGRVDLLGKRFNLTEGLVELQGSLIPIIRLVAETSEDGVTTRIIIDGEARDPEIKFESSPDMPEEEVLSQLLFKRGLSEISPLQAAQLANALAVLAGRGGEGIVGNIRNQVGLDDLDLQTDDEGNVQVRAGKYLSENVYTDVSVGDNGKSTINLNLDITQSLRARGSVDSDGESTLGLYYEKDY